MATDYAFMETVSAHYDEIRRTFIGNMGGLKMDFNEDVFHDTLLNCCRVYKDDPENVEKVKAYFWVAFRTNMLNKRKRTKRMENIDELEGFDIIDEEYVPEMDELFELVRNELYKEFGQETSDIWLRHVTMNESYEKLQAESNMHNMHYQFKKIRKYIRTELPKKSVRFNELLGALDRKL